MRHRPLALAACALAALAAPSVAHGKDLLATVGPGFTIVLADDQGQRVTRLEPGEYRIMVEDRSAEHNFRLTGPGVSLATEVEQIGNVVWNVTLVEGDYTFLCDPHDTLMMGSFTVGIGPAPPAPLPTPPVTPSPPATTPGARRLVATVGPGASISLTLNGRRVRSLSAGAYTVVVRDRSGVHNFHLTGPGLNRRTAVAGRGTFTWRVTLRRGTYRFVCDPHARAMRGSFTVR